MPALTWKLTTFAALGAAAYLAVHPLRAPAKDAKGAALCAAPAPTSAPGSLWGWFGGVPAVAAEAPTGSPARALAQLRAAHTPSAQCSAIQELTPVADEEATAAIADIAQHARIDARVCAVRALGSVRTAQARSWLSELVGDKDAQIRKDAVEALAARPDDAEARSIVLGVAKGTDPELKVTALLALGNAHAKEATPLLLEAMDTADLSTQRQIVGALGGTGDTAATDALAKIAREGASSVRGEALTALGQIGGEQATAVLASALTAGASNDTRTAAAALAQIGDERARKALLLAADADRSDVADAALDALGEVEGDDVRNLMKRNLGGRAGSAQASAARYFRAHPDPAMLADLGALARHGGRESGAEALSALAAIGGKESLAAVSDLATAPGPLQSSALQELSGMPGGKDDARKIALALIRTGGPAAHTAISLLAEDGSADGRQALLDAARAGDGVSGEAMGALARRGDPESVQVLGDLARTGKNAKMRADALESLGQSGDPKVASVLAAAVKDTDPQVRRAALDGLASLGGTQAEKVIIEASSSTDKELRGAAVQALARGPASASSTAQLEKLAKDSDRGVANSAFWSLAQHAPEKAASLAAEQMKSADVEARRTAVQACHMLEPDRARELLLGGLNDADPTVATVAARNLVNIGDTTSQNALAALLSRDDANPEVRRAAADALGEIGGEVAHRFADLIAQHASAAQESDIVVEKNR